MKSLFSLGRRFAGPALVLWGLVLAVNPVSAQQAQFGALSIQGAYVKPTVQGQINSAGYLKITNTGADDKLLSASTGMANQVQLHFMGMQGDVMKMNEVAAIDLPSGKTVELKPGSYHLMILGVKAPIKPGDNLKMKLKFQKAGELEMVFPTSTLESAAHSHEH